MYSATPTRRLYSLYQANQELDKEEIGKPYSKIDLFLCNVSNVDDAADRKVVEDKRVSMERSCIETSPIFKPSNIVADHQKQNANNDEDEFANISPSLSCFHLHRYKTQKIYSCHLYSYKAQIIYKASYNPRQDIKKKLSVAEIF